MRFFFFLAYLLCFSASFATNTVIPPEPQLVISETEHLPMYPEFYLAMNYPKDLSLYLQESKKATESELVTYYELWNTYQHEENPKKKLNALTKLNQLAKTILRRGKNKYHITDFSLRHPSAVEVSGSVLAHKQGIGGAVSVHVMEHVYNDASLPLDQHGYHVLSTLAQVAPHANISVGMGELALKALETCSIMNISRGVTSLEDAKYVLQGIRPSGFLDNRLFIKASGNSNSTIPSQDPLYQSLSKSNDLDGYVLVINLDNSRNISESSNTPGKSKKAQRRALCALGQNVLAPITPYEYAYNTGTSMAAPIVSGAAALVLEKFPNLSAKELATCLLNSADKEFLSFENGKHVYYYEKTPPTQKNKDVEYLKFDPSKYGMGIANLRNALLYAFLKTLNFYHHTQLRIKMQKLIQINNEHKAKMIQRWYRALKNHS